MTTEIKLGAIDADAHVVETEHTHGEETRSHTHSCLFNKKSTFDSGSSAVVHYGFF